MKMLSSTLFAFLALVSTCCVPTITITEPSTDVYKASVNKKVFTVPPDVPFVFWKVDNKSNHDLTVTVDNFYYGDKKREPLACLGQPPLTPAHKMGVLACVVVFDLRENGPYCYNVYVNGSLVADPQVIIKRDGKGLETLGKCPNPY